MRLQCSDTPVVGQIQERQGSAPVLFIAPTMPLRSPAALMSWQISPQPCTTTSSPWCSPKGTSWIMIGTHMYCSDQHVCHKLQPMHTNCLSCLRQCTGLMSTHQGWPKRSGVLQHADHNQRHTAPRPTIPSRVLLPYGTAISNMTLCAVMPSSLLALG